MKSLFMIFKEILIPFITVVTAVLVAILNNSVSQVESQLKERQEVRAERESVHSFDLKIYDKVIQSLEEGDEQKQQVAQALVEVMASDSFRDKLLNILQQTAVDTVKKEVAKIIKKENQFKAEQQALEQIKTTAIPKGDWQHYNFDLFWCETSGDAAEKLAAELKNQLQQAGAKGRIRIRQLPESINLRQGYNISGNIIRANQNEFDVAATLSEAAANMNIDFELTRSTQSTPNYISAFICE